MSLQKIALPISLKGSRLQTEATELIKQKSFQIKQKIDRNLQKQKHIIRLQQQLEQRLRQKNNQILDKLNKSVQTKRKGLDKVKERCHLKLKYETQKISAHRKKQRILAHKSWRESLKLAEKINNRHRATSNKKINLLEENQQNELQQQQLLDKIDDNQQNRAAKNKILPQIAPAHRKQQNNTNGKSALSNSAVVAHSRQINSNTTPNANINTNDKINNKIVEYNQNQLQRQIINKSVSKSCLQKIRLKSQQEQQQQVKKLNAKLLKLEEARMKKQKMQKTRQQQIRDELKFRQQKALQTKKSNKKLRVKTYQHERTKTLGNSQFIQMDNAKDHFLSTKNQMFKKWEQQNKARQEFMFDMRIMKGENYLQSMKQKFMKNKLNKQIELSSIQRKLYIQRRKLHQLSATASKSII